MQTIENKTAIVTGAGQGLGAAISLELASRGANLILNDLQEEKVSEVAKKVRDLGRKCSISLHDISNYQQAQSCVEEGMRELGAQTPLDILVNNAGITRDSMLHKLDEKTFDEVIRVNLKGTFNMGQAFYLYKIKSENKDAPRGGRIINLSSVAARGNIGQTNYAASKAGVIGMTRTWALEMARYKITANAIAPGLFETALTEKIPEDIRAKFVQRIPLKRMGHPKEIAKFVAFLASEDAGYVTGQCITIDGGLTTGW